LLVSKRWRDSAIERINKGAPFDILTPQKLAEIKSKVFALNLSSIREVFIKLIKIQWPPHLKDFEIEAWMTCPLSTVLNHFDKLYRPESFTKIVEDEYKRFLVIKCVEVIASCKNLEDTASIWLRSAQPRKLVEHF
jgi:hypothetical protein